MPLPKEMRAALPDVRDAARAKLCRLCVAQVQALLASADRLATLAQVPTRNILGCGPAHSPTRSSSS